MFFDPQAEQSRTERETQLFDFYKARQTLEQAAAMNKKKSKSKKGSDVSMTGAVYHPIPVESLYITNDEWSVFVNCVQHDVFELSVFGAPDTDERAGCLWA